MRKFLVVWLGQLVSVVGTGLSAFALGVWFYQKSGSVTDYAMISFFAKTPGLLIGPLAGVLVDRYSRRGVMLLSDMGAGLGSLLLLLLFLSDKLELWHVYVVLGLASAIEAFQLPAYTAAISVLVEKKDFGRASGLVDLNQGLSQLLSPAAGGWLVTSLGLAAVLSLDLATFVFAVLTLILIRFPRATVEPKPSSTVTKEFREGWSFIRDRPGLLVLMLMFAAANMLTSTVAILAVPFLLSYSEVKTAGFVLSIGGSGMIAGSLLMAAWGGPKRLVRGIFWSQIAGACCLLLVGVSTSVALFTAGAFAFFASFPVLMGCSRALWLRKTPPELQGRVFSLRRVVAWSTIPIAYALAGPLADHVFEPLMAHGGPLSESVGAVLGTGPGRGIGLLYIVCGLLFILLNVIVFRIPRLRFLEDELSDWSEKS